MYLVTGAVDVLVVKKLKLGDPGTSFLSHSTIFFLKDFSAAQPWNSLTRVPGSSK